MTIDPLGKAKRVKRAHKGHTLEAPNLEKWNKENGYRKCLACDRARGKIQYRPDLRGRFQEIADSYFEEIVGSD